MRLVVHRTVPSTLESYYQKAGCAGRDGGVARCVLLWQAGDVGLHRRQLEVTVGGAAARMARLVEAAVAAVPQVTPSGGVKGPPEGRRGHG